MKIKFIKDYDALGRNDIPKDSQQAVFVLKKQFKAGEIYEAEINNEAINLPGQVGGPTGSYNVNNYKIKTTGAKDAQGKIFNGTGIFPVPISFATQVSEVNDSKKQNYNSKRIIMAVTAILFIIVIFNISKK